MARRKTIAIPAVEAVKEVAGALVSFIRHPFGPADPADDPDYLEHRDRVLRSYGVHAPPPGQVGTYRDLQDFAESAQREAPPPSTKYE